MVEQVPKIWFSSNKCTSYGKKSMFWVSDLPLSLILTFVWLGWGDLANEPPTSRPSTVTPEPLYYNSNEKNTIHQQSFLFGLKHVFKKKPWEKKVACIFRARIIYKRILRHSAVLPTLEFKPTIFYISKLPVGNIYIYSFYIYNVTKITSPSD